jgi:hypothetical protein
MTKLGWAMLAVAAVLLAGCLPVISTTPIGSTTGLGVDPALIGAWRGHSPDNNEQFYLHILGAKTGVLKAVLVSDVSGDDVMIFRTQTAKLGSNHYLNATVVFDKDRLVEAPLKDANIPLLYGVKGKRLTLSLLDEDKVKAAITAGTLTGRIEPSSHGDAVITADAAALDAVFAKPDAVALFKTLMVLTKVE